MYFHFICKMKVIAVVFAFLATHLSSAQVVKLECRDSGAPNPLTCPHPQTCDDQQCSDQNMICCQVTTPGECGFSCRVGDYVGCYATRWWCYGPRVADTATFKKRYDGSVFYIDNQDGVLNAGRAAQIEYFATRTGIPVTFMLLAPVDGSEHRFRMTSYQITHTATKSGLQIVPVDWRIQQNALRFAYKADVNGKFPIPFENDKHDGSGPYHSFVDPVFNGYIYEVQAAQRVNGGINMRFQARICLNTEFKKVDDDQCDYVPPFSPTTSAMTSTTTGEGPDPLCEFKKVPRFTGCIGQASPQYPSSYTQTTVGGSYSNVDMTGELRDGNITSIEYHVTRLAPVVFQVWEEESIPSGIFILRHQLLLYPTVTNKLISVDLEAMGQVMEVANKWRYGFTYIIHGGQTGVPIQYRVINVHDGLDDTGRPYLSAECKTTGCGAGVAIGDKVDLMDRQHLTQKQFNIRPCMTTFEWVEVCEEST